MGLLVSNGHVTLEGLMFDNFFLYPFVDRIMRDFAYFRPRMFDVVIMSLVVEWWLFEVILRGRTNNWMVLCESHQYWF